MSHWKNSPRLYLLPTEWLDRLDSHFPNAIACKTFWEIDIYVQISKYKRVEIWQLQNYPIWLYFTPLKITRLQIVINKEKGSSPSLFLLYLLFFVFLIFNNTGWITKVSLKLSKTGDKVQVIETWKHSINHRQ